MDNYIVPDESQPCYQLAMIVVPILILDAVFSIDSIITAVGMTEHILIMVIAVMLVAADPLARFIRTNPTIVMLAFGFPLWIDTTLIAEGLGAHLPRGCIYAAMAFSLFMEGLNMLAGRARQKRAETVRMNLSN